MKKIGIFYATRQGHALRVAWHVADYFRAQGFEADVWPVIDVPNDLDLQQYAGLIVTASVHMGRHEPEMTRFVREHLAEIDARRNAFITITLSQAGVERVGATDADRSRSAADVFKMTEQFILETGWRPQRIHPVAGALLYTRYNPLLRLVMKWISRKAGGSTDTTRDHVYTDWAGLDRLAEVVALDVRDDRVAF